MLKVSSSLKDYAIAAGEPFLFEVQFQEASGAVTDLSARLFVLSFYGVGRALIDKIDRECQEFRVRAGIEGKKETRYVPTQRACDTERAAGSAAGWR